MKAKLVKQELGYILFDEKGIPIGNTPNVLNNNTFSKLSIKNCQAIERGYDLDEISEKEFPLLDESWCRTGATHEENLQLLGHRNSYIKGFQKALELMGNKKYSEEDVISMIEKSRETGLTAQFLILTKQESQWDVEVEMICPHPEDTYVCGIGYGCDEDGCNHPNQVPLLDSDGCLILKLKSE